MILAMVILFWLLVSRDSSSTCTYNSRSCTITQKQQPGLSCRLKHWFIWTYLETLSPFSQIKVLPRNGPIHGVKEVNSYLNMECHTNRLHLVFATSQIVFYNPDKSQTGIFCMRLDKRFFSLALTLGVLSAPRVTTASSTRTIYTG